MDAAIMYDRVAIVRGYDIRVWLVRFTQGCGQSARCDRSNWVSIFDGIALMLVRRLSLNLN